MIILDDETGPCFPIILDEKCDGCAKTGKPRCIEFCPNGVFEYRDGKAVVAYPAKCGSSCSTVNCSACAPLCHKRAIIFPSRSASFVPVKQEDKGMIRKTTCKVCGKQYWTNREIDVCMDYENKKRTRHEIHIRDEECQKNW